MTHHGKIAAGIVFVMAGALVLFARGCEANPHDLGKVVSVAGSITVGGKPLQMGLMKFGRVWYYPDAAKGNKCPQVFVGDIDEKGEYKLFCRGQEGTPPGWYKVMVVATEQIDGGKPSRKRQSFVPAKYGDVRTSGLSVNVTEAAASGAFDLRLK